MCWAPSSRARLGKAKHSFRFRSREASGGGWGLVERIFTDFRTVCNLIIVARKQAWREGAKRKKICRIAGWRTQFSFRLSKNCLEMSILNFCLPDAPTGLASLSSVPRRCKKKSQKPARVLAAKKNDSNFLSIELKFDFNLFAYNWIIFLGGERETVKEIA